MLYAALVAAALAHVACGTQENARLVMPWMCLDDCGDTKEGIAAELQQLATPGVFTDASFEDWDLEDGVVVKKTPRTRGAAWAGSRCRCRVRMRHPHPHTHALQCPMPSRRWGSARTR